MTFLPFRTLHSNDSVAFLLFVILLDSRATESSPSYSLFSHLQSFHSMTPYSTQYKYLLVCTIMPSESKSVIFFFTSLPLQVLISVCKIYLVTVVSADSVQVVTSCILQVSVEEKCKGFCVSMTLGISRLIQIEHACGKREYILRLTSSRDEESCPQKLLLSQGCWSIPLGAG